MRDTRARDGTVACEGCARAVSEVRRVKTRGATGVWDPRTARIRRRFSRRARTRRTVAARRFETRSFKGCLKTRTVCPSRTVALGGGLKRACGDRARGGEAGEPPSPRVPSTVLDRARRARVGAAAGATAVARARGEARDARLRGAGDAARAGGQHAFNELGFFERVCVSSRGARRRKERRAGTRTRHEAGPSRGDETRAWRRASKWPVEEQDAKYRRRLRSDRERKALFEVHFSHCSAPSNIETFLLKTGCAYVEY